MRVLGIDYGERRVGVAVSDPGGEIALCLRVVTVRSDDEALQAVKKAYEETGSDKAVVGMPINMNGTRGPMAAKAEAFARQLAALLGAPVETWDERLSTSLAERTLLEADMSRQKRRNVRDKLSAQIILQGYLDRMNAAQTAAGKS